MVEPKVPKDLESGRRRFRRRGLNWVPSTGADAYNKYAPDGRLDRQTSGSEPEHDGLLRPDLRDLYVTSATRGNPNEGGIFRLRVDVSGLARPIYAR
jgi:sugar lactone lactonase YvrE